LKEQYTEEKEENDTAGEAFLVMVGGARII